MPDIIKSFDTQQKLSILSQDSQYDLACACGTNDNDRRKRTKEGKWLYPVSLPNGGSSVLFKTLVSNVCINDCAYCPLRVGVDQQRCVIDPEVIASVFLDLLPQEKGVRPLYQQWGNRLA